MRYRTRGAAGRSLDCEVFDRFFDKAESLGLEVTLGAAHVPTNPGAHCEVPDSAAGERWAEVRSRRGGSACLLQAPG